MSSFAFFLLSSSSSLISMHSRRPPHACLQYGDTRRSAATASTHSARQQLPSLQSAVYTEMNKLVPFCCFMGVFLTLILTALSAPAVAAVGDLQQQQQQPVRHLLQSQKFEQCKAAFDGLGGSEQEIAQKLPACTQSQPVLGDCCSQVKGLLSQAPSECLCDSDVWNAVQAKAGSSSATLKQFLEVCSIPNAGTGNC